MNRIRKIFAALMLSAAACLCVNADSHYGALIEAIESKNIAKVRHIISITDDVDCREYDGWGIYIPRPTPLMYAAEYNFADAAKLLIDAGAEINASFVINRGGFRDDGSVLAIAVRHESADVVKVLLDAGAVDIGGALTVVIRRRSIGYDEEVWKKNLVTWNDSAGVEKLLKEAAMNVNKKDSWKETALRYAAMHNYVDVARRQIKAGADVNEGYNPPLVYAAEWNSVDVAKLLIKAGADVNERYEPPLVCAAAYNSVNVAKLLIKAGADVNMKDHYGFTAADYAYAQDYKDMVKLLIKAGADANEMKNSALRLQKKAFSLLNPPPRYGK